MKQKFALKNWSFKIDSLGFSKEVSVPHTWNVEENEAVQLYRGKADYTAEVSLENIASKKAVLYFGAVFHTAEVFVNGNPAGGHSGSGYTPFEIDITDFIKEGCNTVSVTADNLKKAAMLPHELDYDWADDGGLIREVYLTLYDTADIYGFEISYEIFTIENGCCSGRLNLNIDALPQPAEISLTECDTGNPVLKKSAYIGGGISLDFEGLKLWSCSEPNLYEIHIKTENDEAVKHTGFRKIEVKDTKVLLNGKEIYLKGCEWMPGSHPDYGMAEPLWHTEERLAQLKSAGCVFTRFHWQQDDSLYDWCDRNGLLVQEEIPYWGHPKVAAYAELKIAEMQADEMVHYHSHHPSIICWGVGNELRGYCSETIDYVKNMYAYFKNADASRLVNYVSNTLSLDGCVDSDDAALHGDIAMWNDYLGLWQGCSRIEEVILRTYNKIGNMPSLVSEFGLCEPKFSGGDERRTEILLQRITIYRKLENMVGYVWFSLNDYRTHIGEDGQGRFKQRIHGSTDLYGKEKPSYKVLTKL